MAESIKSFIDKLQAEGVEAGKSAAEKIQSEAEQRARQIIDDAEKRAEKIIADAKSQAESFRLRVKTEINLAARDAALQLQDRLNQALDAILAIKVQNQLEDTEFLKTLIHDIVMQFVHADSEGKTTLTINVSPEVQKQLTDWLIQTLHDASDIHGKVAKLQGTLSGVGFEYYAVGGKVEITTDSITEVLSGLVGPEVREILQKAMQGNK